jgi:hypothetical protein
LKKIELADLAFVLLLPLLIQINVLLRQLSILGTGKSLLGREVGAGLL